jgi:hypothetical protein
LQGDCEKRRVNRGSHVSRAGHYWWSEGQLCKKIVAGGDVAREIDIKGRRYWILSEPENDGWKASVVEVHEDGSNEQIGIDASGETRVAADDAAERKLRRLLQAY